MTVRNVLVTGGLGFIGSHTVLSLVDNGFDVTIIDNLSNCYKRALCVLRRLAGRHADRISFEQVDVRDAAELKRVFSAQTFDCVIHFAAFKAVGESVEIPLAYYDNNMNGSIQLVKAMAEAGCKKRTAGTALSRALASSRRCAGRRAKLVFSSSCTVYGEPEVVPLDESHRRQAISPYGRTKLFQEHMFADMAAADPAWSIIVLRYFNPVSAHPSGELGEHPVGVPLNLMPFVQQVAVGLRPELKVYGGDYPTRDGTCIRDYIHVMDLADAHVAASHKLLASSRYGCKAINVGTGNGTTVLEMVKAFEDASGKEIPYTIVDRRPGDVVATWAATDLAQKELGWSAKYTVEDMCSDQWRWASKHPAGFDDVEECL